jgi:hypothetical protein
VENEALLFFADEDRDDVVELIDVTVGAISRDQASSALHCRSDIPGTLCWALVFFRGIV